MQKVYQVVLIAGLLAVSASVSAEEVVAARSEASTRNFELSGAYFGELFAHPGLVFGAKFPLVDRSWFDLTAGPSVGFYVHPRNHSALFIDGELENRFTTPFGLFATVGGAVGYQHAWLGGGGPYVRGDDGAVEKRFDWGRPYFKTGLSLGLGWDFEKNRLAPLRFFTRLDAYGRMPFNRAILPHAALQVGLVYRFGGSR